MTNSGDYYQPNNNYVTPPQFSSKRQNTGNQSRPINIQSIDSDNTMDIETKVLTLHSNKFSDYDIADSLHISINQVKYILNECYEDPAPKKRRRPTRKQANQRQHNLNVDRLDAAYILFKHGVPTKTISYLLKMRHSNTKHQISLYTKGDKILQHRNNSTHDNETSPNNQQKYHSSNFTPLYEPPSRSHSTVVSHSPMHNPTNISNLPSHNNSHYPPTSISPSAIFTCATF